MMQVLSRWVTCIMGTALLCSAAIALTPDGKMKRAVKFVCGCVMVISMLSPAVGLNLDDISIEIARYMQQAESTAVLAQETARECERAIIESESAAYISDKGASLGIERIEAEVIAEWNSDGYWIPVSVCIRSDAGEYERKELSHCIETDLGISQSRQEWITYD